MLFRHKDQDNSRLVLVVQAEELQVVMIFSGGSFICYFEAETPSCSQDMPENECFLQPILKVVRAYMSMEASVIIGYRHESDSIFWLCTFCPSSKGRAELSRLEDYLLV